MSQFFLIDQSLDSGGGHHFDYATCIADAAQEMGFETVVATNRKLHANIAFEQSLVAPVFRHSVYHRSSSLAGLKHLKRVRNYHPEGPSSAWQRTRKLWTDHQRKSARNRVIQQFASDCAALFDRHELCGGDHVFLMTISELELMGLAEFLHRRPQLVSVAWHLQFHFNLFDGRTPEFDAQRSTLEETQQVFRDALSLAKPHRLQMYTTSEPLRDQYQRLNVCDFSELPYPVCPAIFAGHENLRLPNVPNLRRNKSALAPHVATLNNHRAHSSSGIESARGGSSPVAATLINRPEGPVAVRKCSPHDRHLETHSASESQDVDHPLRFTCPGQIRREKGCCGYLQRLVSELWDSHFATGLIQIAVQRPRRKFMRSEKLELKTPVPGNENDVGTGIDMGHAPEPIKYVAHPLERDAYIDFIRSADCGLLLYDSRAYYSRRAGVLGELLSCGKPVIVPAGCWLSEQIAESIYSHADDLFESHSQAKQTFGLSSLAWDPANVPTDINTISFDQSRNPFSFRLDIDSASFLKVSFDWKWPKTAGTFCRISLQQFVGDDLLATTDQVVGQRQSNRLPNALFRVDPSADRVIIAMSNAYSDATAMARDLKIELLSLDADEARATPTGSVGIIAASPECVADAVREMTTHISHYRKTAGDFSQHWASIHHPERTVARLVQTSESANSFDWTQRD